MDLWSKTFEGILKEGCDLVSSGTDGPAKKIHRTPENLDHCIKVSLEAQKIDNSSKVLTVTRMSHAGGLLLQSLPAFSIGAEVKVTTFSAYSFLEEFKNYTHTFLVPKMCEALMKTKNFSNYNFNGKFICMGSDPIPKTHIEEFTKRNAFVMANWGMSEVGPCVINKIYKPNEKGDHWIVGNKFWCDWKIEDKELYIKTPMCIYDDWFATGDLVELSEDQQMFYLGRKPLEL